MTITIDPNPTEVEIDERTQSLLWLLAREGFTLAEVRALLDAPLELTRSDRRD